MKKFVNLLTAAVITFTSVFAFSGSSLLNMDSVWAANDAFEANYAEALQKSLYFYECQQAGNLPDWNRVEWRADATTGDYIDGGWYDAGDHVKFNLPMSYSASMLAWGLYQYGDGIKDIGQFDIYKNNLQYALDYFADCDLGDKVVFQVGNGQQDHTWWGPVELYEYGMADNGYDVTNRPYYTGTKCSAVCGGMSAALASGAAALKGKVDDSVIQDYITHAESIFAIGDSARSDAEYADSDANGFYRSSHFYDQLFYAANWLYIATGEQKYLDKATSYLPSLDKELGSDEMKYTWCMCWDDTMQGGMLLYAQNTKDDFYISRIEKHINYWCDDVKEIDGGLRWSDSWGCLRYATTAGFLAAVTADTLVTDSTLKAKYKEFYEEQINYCLGDNPTSQSFVVGYDDNSPINVHHRTSHASWKNDLKVPETNRHILYGALVGGPSSDGSYTDDRGNFQNNEVATDYNAGFTALLCKMVDDYGGATDANFPESEKKDLEFYVEGAIKQNSSSGVSLSLKFTNHTAWPARVVNNMSYRYYMDISEVVEAGFTANDVVVRVDRDQSAMYKDEYDNYKTAVISGLQRYNDNIYYVEVTYPDGRAALPISEGQNQCETMLALVFPNYQTGWDAANDYSNQDMLNSTDSVITDKITVYENGVLIYGTEPDGTTPANVVWGDANCDGKVNSLDASAVKCHLLELVLLTEQGKKNADVNSDGSVTIADIVKLKKYILNA